MFTVVFVRCMLRCGNVASILEFNDSLERKFKLFHEVC